MPGNLLRAGTNVMAVELHSMTAGATRAFFDLEATAYAATGDASTPSAPVLSAAASGTGRVGLTWSAATDDIAVGGYRITRDGQPLAVTGPSSTGYVDGSVDHRRGPHVQRPQLRPVPAGPTLIRSARPSDRAGQEVTSQV